ncbi:unnamed protein product [Periconia digitata]|uniref:ATP-grasp domain-containing protein n=1 Tax=Periconia digitata TaxID=1303443 RepID=A0A9W4UM67_9PLEO|nr:unnamed protein product [Periconia digitata]
MEFEQAISLQLPAKSLLVHLSWTWNDGIQAEDFVTLDVVLRPEDKPEGDWPPHLQSWESTLEKNPGLRNFLYDCLIQPESHPIVLRCISSTTSGYVTRADFLEYHLPSSNSIEKIAAFVGPCEYVKALPPHANLERSFQNIAPFIMGCVLLPETLRSSADWHTASLDALLAAGLSPGWLSKEPLKKTCVVWVGGRALEPGDHVSKAASAMGVSLVLVESPDYPQRSISTPNARLPDKFISMDMTTDAGFTERLLKAVTTFSTEIPVNGLCTIDEIYTIQVAQACQVLGLPCSPTECYINALDKFTTRSLELDTHGSFRVYGVEDLHRYLGKQQIPFPYPMVVRPCVGWSSQCVAKVSNEDELFRAVQNASDRHAVPNTLEWFEPRTDVIVEPYIEGPEVDANFILLDGELLFCEISDDFPSPADLPPSGAQQQDNFLETIQLIPSNLPNDEQSLLRRNIHESILRQGFTTGVFHCEARVQYSSARYTTEGGIFDLRWEGDAPRSTSVKTFLHEINPRPPAYQSTMAILGAYGVDYYALHLAACLNDKVRFRAFSQPLKHAPQHTVAVKYLHESLPGTMATNDAGTDLLMRVPRLQSNVPFFKTLKKKGDGLRKSGWLSFLAYFVIVSKISRKDCLELVRLVEDEFRFAVE